MLDSSQSLSSKGADTYPLKMVLVHNTFQLTRLRNFMESWLLLHHLSSKSICSVFHTDGQ